MGKVIYLPLPDLSEDRAKEILDNVTAVACLPDAQALLILQQAEYMSYKFNRDNGMKATDLHTIGFSNALEFEAIYLEEKEKADGE
ncbi:MAG: hypothetical protein JRJ45_07835 [Deltaproteobacteria bacterium]|nr:hypothetical protein [Deltaproteobacteria bacterium]